MSSRFYLYVAQVSASILDFEEADNVGLDL